MNVLLFRFTFSQLIHLLALVLILETLVVYPGRILTAEEPTDIPIAKDLSKARSLSVAHQHYQRLHDSRIMLVRAREEHQLASEAEAIESHQQEAILAAVILAQRQAELDRDRYLKGEVFIEEQRLLDQIAMARNRLTQAVEKAAASERLANQGLLNQKELTVDEVSRERAQRELKNRQQALKVLREVTFQRRKILLEGAVQLAKQTVVESRGKKEAAIVQLRSQTKYQQQLLETWEERVRQLQQQWSKTGFQRIGEPVASTQRDIPFATPRGGMLVVQTMAPPGTKVSRGDTLATFKPQGLEETVAVQKLKYQQAASEVDRTDRERTLQQDRFERSITAARITAKTSKLSIGEYRVGTYEDQRQTIVLALQKVTEERDRAVQQLAWSRRVRQKGYVTPAQVQKDEYLLFDRNSVRSSLVRELAVLEQQDYMHQLEMLQKRYEEAVVQVDRVTAIGAARSRQSGITFTAAQDICELEKQYLALLSSQLAGYSIQAPCNGTVRYLPVPGPLAKVNKVMKPGTVVSGNVRFAILRKD